uniref:SAM domain-containing protein n=1 Tax=Eutreptiella gymnastica TaxID=73025 RepID=A0A7S1NH76_9EUGL|mmetsp:Transcript_3769/g.6637  ORF Transcript_3769/g.6637 Transcript_3769/m.6637 type:complete len:254 (+) Transcript_3769:22-783(+)
MPSGWNVEQVLSWVESIGFGEYRATFESNHVDGPTLLDLSPTDLKNELEIPSLRARKEIYAAIQALKSGDSLSSKVETKISSCDLMTQQDLLPVYPSSPSPAPSSTRENHAPSSTASPPLSSRSRPSTASSYTFRSAGEPLSSLSDPLASSTASPWSYGSVTTPSSTRVDVDYHRRKIIQETSQINGTAPILAHKTSARSLKAIDQAKSSYCNRTRGYKKVDYASMLEDQIADEQKLEEGDARYEQILKEAGF